MDVFQFLDPYAVMRAYYQDRKAREEKFSYTSWAKELGVQSSSTLRMMVHGEKKISLGLAEKFLSIFPHEDEKNYFRLLLSYAHAANPQEKSAVWAALAKILVARIDQTEAADYFTYLSDLILPKLQTLLSFDDQAWTEESLAQALNVEVATVCSGVRSLENIGMAESVSTDSGHLWKAKVRMVKVSDKLGDVALKSYHNACLEEAKKAQDLDVSCRRYRSLMLPMSEEEFQNINKKVDTFVKQLLMKYQSDQYTDRRLYKLNLNYFPVSEKMESEF